MIKTVALVSTLAALAACGASTESTATRANEVALTCKSSNGQASAELIGSELQVRQIVGGDAVSSSTLQPAGDLGGYDNSDVTYLYRSGSLTAQLNGKSLTLFNGNKIVANMSCKK